jgi:CheY-like chemotaxis protein
VSTIEQRQLPICSTVDQYSAFGISTGEVWAMSESSKYSILVVDDDTRICESISMLLNYSGYNVDTAMHGLDAINKLRFAIPDLILSDLNMPVMSGFEFLSVVRYRFPQIPVIAMSGMAGYDNQLPDGVIADAFYGKGGSRPGELMLMVANLIQKPLARAINEVDKTDFLQQPRYQNMPDGTTSMLLSCPDCLRGMSIELVDKNPPELLETHCPSCMSMFRYECWLSLAGILGKHYGAAHTISVSAPQRVAACISQD